MTQTFILESKQLIREISEIDDRHLLELLAVHSGLKSVMRIHITKPTEYDCLKQYCQKHGMHVGHSTFRLKMAWRNDIGDSFFENAPWSDETAEQFVAYISRNNLTDLNKALSIEVEGNHLDSGRLYGYPDCCCLGYESISEGEPWVTCILNASNGVFFSPWANKLAYLVHDYALFPDYFPCSLDCKGTAELARQYFELGRQNGLGSLVEMQLDYMSRCYLASVDSIYSFSNWELNGRNLILKTDGLTIYGHHLLADFSETEIVIELPGDRSNCFWSWQGVPLRVLVFNEKGPEH
jgi:hypothetical protein